jgi:hypothetical protein
VHRSAVAAARRAGLSLADAVPTQIDEIPSTAQVVTVCDLVHEELEPGPDWWHWSIPDPVATGTPAAFDAVVAELDARIAAVLHTDAHADDERGRNDDGTDRDQRVRADGAPRGARPAAPRRPELVHVNERKGGIEVAAHLLEFDTVHGRYDGSVGVDGDRLVIDGRPVAFSEHGAPGDIPWERAASIS